MSVSYRAAVPSDVQVLTPWAAELAQLHYPQLRPSYINIKSALRLSISSASDYVHVAEKDGKIVAVLGVLVHDGLWTERKVANVALWVSEHEGAGRELMRQFLDWVAPRRAVRLIMLTPMSDALFTQYESALSGFGFEAAGGSLIKYN
jgi:hypothetical protein